MGYYCSCYVLGTIFVVKMLSLPVSIGYYYEWYEMCVSVVYNTVWLQYMRLSEAMKAPNIHNCCYLNTNTSLLPNLSV